MNFCKLRKFLLIQLSKMFQKLWMLLLLLCLGTILASSCTASCQPSSSLPPQLGPPQRCGPISPPTLQWPLRFSSLWPPLLHHPSWVTRRVHRRQPPQGLHSDRRRAWQPSSPRQTTEFATRQPCRNQVGLVFRPTGFVTFLSGAATKRSRNRFPTRQ
jgi:hypothetical protein